MPEGRGLLYFKLVLTAFGGVGENSHAGVWVELCVATGRGVGDMVGFGLLEIS